MYNKNKQFYVFLSVKSIFILMFEHKEQWFEHYQLCVC